MMISYLTNDMGYRSFEVDIFKRTNYERDSKNKVYYYSVRIELNYDPDQISLQNLNLSGLESCLLSSIILWLRQPVYQIPLIYCPLLSSTKVRPKTSTLKGKAHQPSTVNINPPMQSASAAVTVKLDVGIRSEFSVTCIWLFHTYCTRLRSNFLSVYSRWEDGRCDNVNNHGDYYY